MLYSQSVRLIPNQPAMLSARLSPDPETIDRYVARPCRMFLARYGKPLPPPLVLLESEKPPFFISNGP